MAILFSDTFASGNLSQWSLAESTTIPQVQQGRTLEGMGFAAHCSPSTGECIMLKDLGSSPGKFGARIPIYRVSAAGETPLFFAMYGAGGAGDQPAVKVQLVAGNLVLRTMPADSTYVDTTVDTFGAMNTATWYLVDLKVDATANPWHLNWRVNGVEQAGANPAIAAGTFNRIRAGAFAYAMVWDAYVDSVKVSDQFEYLTADYSGPGKIPTTASKPR